jgi:hypothetical protein
MKDRGFGLGNFWLVCSGICLTAAAVLFLKRHMDAGFVFATIGAVAWFLNYRVGLKGSLEAEQNEPVDDIKDDKNEPKDG